MDGSLELTRGKGVATTAGRKLQHQQKALALDPVGDRIRKKQAEMGAGLTHYCVAHLSQQERLCSRAATYSLDDPASVISAHFGLLFWRDTRRSQHQGVVQRVLSTKGAPTNRQKSRYAQRKNASACPLLPTALCVLVRAAAKKRATVRCKTMLAAGRSFPAVTAARRAAAARSTGAQRSSAILIRTLSSEGTPGTVAGARAAASAGRLSFVLSALFSVRAVLDRWLVAEVNAAPPGSFSFCPNGRGWVHGLSLERSFERFNAWREDR